MTKSEYLEEIKKIYDEFFQIEKNHRKRVAKLHKQFALTNKKANLEDVIIDENGIIGIITDIEFTFSIENPECIFIIRQLNSFYQPTENVKIIKINNSQINEVIKKGDKRTRHLYDKDLILN